jgi:hypothetical protein
MTLEHGRTRYTRGCRCEACKAAERDYQRNRYRRRRRLPIDEPDPAAPPALIVVNSPADSPDGSVVAAVRAEFEAAPTASVRPGLAAVALGLAAILDYSNHVATQPAAARQLVAIPNTLSKPARRRGKLAVVKAMTGTGRHAD